jgi:NitT/TauT family transport system substrate-binding protein
MTTKSRIRTGAAILAAASLALVGCSSGNANSPGSGDLEGVTLLSPIPPSMFFFPGFVADALGFFEEEGIEFTYETSGEGISMTSLLANGQVQIAAPGGTEVIQGRNAGQVFSVIYDYTVLASEGIVVPADSDIKSIDDLAGATVGISSDEVRSLLEISLDTVELTSDDLEIANVGASGATIASSFDSGAIDAFVGSVLDFSALAAAGVELRAITPEEVATLPGSSLAVMDKFADSNKDLVERFLRAWSKGLYAGLANPDLVEAVMREASPAEWEDEALGKATLGEAIKLQDQGADNDTYGELNTDAWEQAVELAVVAGDIDKRIDTESFLSSDFLEAANEFDRAAVDKAATEFLSSRG